MAKKPQKKKSGTKPAPEPLPKDFLDMIAPAAVRFNTDHYILGGAYHCALALRSYPTGTEELALLRGLGERSGVTVSVRTRRVTPAEEQKIIQNAANRGRMERSSTNDMKQTVTAEANLQDVAALVSAMHRSREPLIHCAVYLDLAAKDLESLRSLREEVMGELVRSKLGVDRILLRQQEGFLSNPTTIEYIRNCMKRVRKKDSSLLLASQNIEDFALPGIAEMTRPLFSIPTHQFLFNAGSIDRRFFMDNLQLEESEYELIRYPQRGVCLYKCGNERYLLEVHAPPYKERLFGKAGGR